MFKPSQFSDDGYGYASGADGRMYAAQTMFDTYSTGNTYGGWFDEALKVGADLVKRAGQKELEKVATGESSLAQGDKGGIFNKVGNLLQIGKKKKEQAEAAAKKKRMLAKQRKDREAQQAAMEQARLEAEQAMQVKLVMGGSALALVLGIGFTKFVFPKW